MPRRAVPERTAGMLSRRAEETGERRVLIFLVGGGALPSERGVDSTTLLYRQGVADNGRKGSALYQHHNKFPGRESRLRARAQQGANRSKLLAFSAGRS